MSGDLAILMIAAGAWVAFAAFNRRAWITYFWYEYAILQDVPGRLKEIRRKANYFAVFGPYGLPAVLLGGGLKHIRKPMP